MPEVGRELEDAALDIEAVALPAPQRAHGEAMAQVMPARSVRVRRSERADLPGQLHERFLQCP